MSALRAVLDAPSGALLVALVRTADERGIKAWAVGGAVRDVALGRPVHDLDVAIDGDAGPLAEAVAESLPARHSPAVTVEPRFGTATVDAGPPEARRRLDLARLRTETYAAPGALSAVRFTDDIDADLRRRDFSVNAIALGLGGPRRGDVVDPCGGLEDLGARRLRVLHDRSFVDDATRLWRGARTASLFDLAPDEGTARLIAEGTRWLAPVSGERLGAELALTAERGRAGRTLALAEAWGVLEGTHPALRLAEATRAALRRRPGPLAPAMLAALLLAPLLERGAVLDRFAATRTVRQAVGGAAALLAAGEGEATSGRLEALVRTPADARLAARWLDPTRQAALQRALARWERTRAPLDAEALAGLGVPRGPELGRALDGLRRARYLGTVRDGAAARREVRRRLAAGEAW